MQCQKYYLFALILSVCLVTKVSSLKENVKNMPLKLIVSFGNCQLSSPVFYQYS